MTMRLSTNTYLTALTELEDATRAYLRARKAERKRMDELQALVAYWAGAGVSEVELASITGLSRTTVRRAAGKVRSSWLRPRSAAPAQPPHEEAEQNGDQAGAETDGDVHG